MSIKVEYTVEKIYDQLGNALKRFIFSRIEDSMEADDIFQEVFIKIHNNIERVHDETKIVSWVFQIARNTIIDALRKRKPRAEMHEAAGIHDIDNDEVLNGKIIAEGIRRLIDFLPEKYRQALIYTEYEGMTQKELAARLNLSIPGAKSRVQRARKLLKDIFMEFCHFEFDKYGTIIEVHPKSCTICEKVK